MKKLLLTTTLLTMIASMASASEQTSPGKELAELAFKSVAESGRDFIDMGEMENFRKLVFISMDGDQNKKISLREFMNWDYGMSNLAEDTGRVNAYNTALKVVFSFWDINGDGEINASEHRKAIIADFQRADEDNNAVISKEEFLNGFSIMLALKAALKED